MDNSFFAYLQQLELIAFFSGYPLIYIVTHFIAGTGQTKNNFKKRMVMLLPFAYALVGTLYLGLQLKNLYPHYALSNIKENIQHPYLTAWALLSLLFWIPALGKKTWLSLLHSLVFFFLIIKDFFLKFYTSSADNNMVQNDMKIYSLSLALNGAALVVVILLHSLFIYLKKRSDSSSALK